MNREGSVSDPIAGGSPPTPPPRPQSLSIASTVCWLWGAVLLVVGVYQIVRATAGQRSWTGPTLYAGVLLLLGGMFVFGGFALRRQRQAGAWVSGAAAVLVSALPLHEPAIQSPMGIAMSLAILGLVLANWRHLRRA